MYKRQAVTSGDHGGVFQGLGGAQTLAYHLAFTRYDGSKADSVEMPTLGADNGLALVSMIGADYDDPQWDTLLDQLTFNEMVNTCLLYTSRCV